MRIALAALAGIGIPGAAGAQDRLAPAPAPAPAPDPTEILVTAPGLPPPPGETTLASVTIGRAELAAAASGRLESVLTAIAGIAQFRRSDARSANPTSQGITLRGLGGNAASRALLILDGVPQADPFGGWIAFPAYDPDAIAAIRVIRGGGGGVAGPGALAGTIEIDSGAPVGLNAALAGGSRGSLDASAGFGARGAGGGVALSASVQSGDGFVPVIAGQRGAVDRPAPYVQARAALRGTIPLGSGLELQPALAAFTDRRDRGTAFSTSRSEGADASLRLVGTGRWPWSALGYLQTRGFASQFASVDAARGVVTPTLDQYSVPASGIGARFELAPPLGRTLALRLGADTRALSGRTQERFSYVAGQPTRRREAGGTSRTIGLFADASAALGPLTLALAGRIDAWRLADGRLAETPLAGGAPFADTRFSARAGTEPTARIGAAWTRGAATLRAAAYRGWRLPTLNELYRPFRLGADATAANPALAPERLRGAELGADVATGGLRASATLFANRLSDAIANVTLGTGPGSFPGVGFVAAGGAYRQRRNLDAVRAAGAEFDLRWAAGPWRIAASYAFTDARIAATGAAAPLDGLVPAQVARHAASTGWGWSRGDAAVDLTARYTAPQFDDDLGQRPLAAALTLDVRVAIPLSHAIAIEARAENLFGEEVQVAISGAGLVERTAPRALWLGMRYRLR